MYKRYKIVLSAVVVGLSVLWLGLFLQRTTNDSKLQEKFVFANSYDFGKELDGIVITTAEDVIDLKREQSYWLVANKGNYYADFGLMHQFLDSMNKSIYTLRLPYNETVARENYLLNPEKDKKNAGMLVRTYAKGKLLDEVIIGTADKDGRYFFARPVNQNEIWLINGAFNLPIVSWGWLLRPVLSIVPTTVESVAVGDKKVWRETETGAFYNDTGIFDLGLLQQVLSNLTAVNVLSEKNFNEAGFEDLSKKVITIVTFDGLEYICTFYYDNQGRGWLNVKLSTTPLPMAAVNDYIRDNGFLYDGWYFETAPVQRHVLRDFNLM